MNFILDELSEAFLHPISLPKKSKEELSDISISQKMASHSQKRLIKNIEVITKGFIEAKDYKFESFSESKHLIKSSPTNSNKNLGSPSPNHLKVEIRFYNDTLLIISILIEMFIALIEELKLPSSSNKLFLFLSENFK